MLILVRYEQKMSIFKRVNTTLITVTSLLMDGSTVFNVIVILMRNYSGFSYRVKVITIINRYY